MSFHDAAAGAAATREVTLDRLGMQPADVVALAGGSPEAMSEIDDRLSDVAIAEFGARPDVPVTIRYMDRGSAPVSVFEVLPLVRALKAITSGVRPLMPSDLSLPGEARAVQDAVPVVDRARIARVERGMRDLAGDLSTLIERLDAAQSAHAAGRSHLLETVDALASDLGPLLARAALFGVPQAGREFVRDFRRRLFAGVLAQAADLVERWTRQLDRFDQAIAGYDALPQTAADGDRFALLATAAAAIAARPILPRPATPAALRAQLAGARRAAFVERRDQFAEVQQTKRRRVDDLLGDVRRLLPIDEVDSTPFTLEGHEDAVVRFVDEAGAVAASMRSALTRRVTEAAAHLATHDGSGLAADRARALEAAAKALLGDDVVIVPTYALPAAQRDEVSNALAASRSGALFEHLVRPAGSRTPPIDFPVDTWLHGAARVRERLRAWEQATILAGALGRPEPPLDALQLPHVPGDKWLGLDIPAGHELDVDRLLYTAHFAEAPDADGRLCGLLLDEWTETIPAAELDTGIAFHFDRPNAESPQAMLLVTPSEFRGGWQWNDLLDAVNETLDLAKRRAVEPAHLDKLPLAPYLPATITASQVRQLTIAANLALNNAGIRSGE